MTVFGGDIIYASDLNTIYDGTIDRPIVRLVQAVAQSVPNNTATAITFTTEAIDTHGFHDPVTNNSRITPSVAGYYSVYGRVVWANDTDYTVLEARIGRNGSIQAASDRNLNPGTANTAGRSPNVKVIVSCNGTTDYIELYGLQNNTSAAANDTNASGHYTSILEVEFLRGL